MNKIQEIEKNINQLNDEIKALEIRQALKDLEIKSLVDLSISTANPQSNNKKKIDTLFSETIADLMAQAEKAQKIVALKKDLISSLIDQGTNGSVVDYWEQLKNSSFAKTTSPDPSVILNSGTTTQDNTPHNQTPPTDESEEKEIEKWEIDKADIIFNREAKLGSGAFGSVFKGVVRGKEVAIKKLTQQFFDESIMNEFKKEVCLMTKLRNPHLLLFMGACTTPGDLCIVTELMPKGSVHSLLRVKDDSPDFITFQRAILIARDTALGMNWLHLSNPPILHLDLKPANLLVDNNWVVKVADFGLSKIKIGSSTTGQAGSPLYMAPEMLLNKEYDEKCDVFSFGILLWELLTKQEPYNKAFTSYPELSTGVAHRGVRPTIPDYFPTRLKEFLNRCWEQNPVRRPSFSDITKQKILDLILIDGLVTDHGGRQFWAHHFLGKEEVGWNQFYPAFCSSFAIDMRVHSGDSLTVKCLRLLLVPIDSESVSLEQFGKILSWFGPLNGGEEFMDRVNSICSIKGFLGEASSKNVAQYLAGKKSGTYIIRFSSEPGCYAISYLSKTKEITHTKVVKQPQGYKHFGGNTFYPSIDELIKNTFKNLGLKDPFEGGQFHALMQGAKNPNLNLAGAYIAVPLSKKI
ncbi:hypothetical protein CYY_005491 [Polysphondylium violaceum]|uniref:SH2 domain-containing protein n=1 Tax=Polysphondylium violaceum TaxID=133409 RepID=A0A8J4PWC1_9MYCE|nr:hypothetical protein CYY_005491 [Polysphondylium violaceum]